MHLLLGVRYVGVVCGPEYTYHPAIENFSFLGSLENWREGAQKGEPGFVPVRFNINGSHVGFFRVANEGNGMVAVHKTGMMGKNWGGILKHLLTTEVDPAYRWKN